VESNGRPLARSATRQTATRNGPPITPLTSRTVLDPIGENRRAYARRARKPDRRLFEFMALNWEWSYGDSNSGPLACHQQAVRPGECVCAGQRPVACAGVRSGLH